jgi:hypothetical protein
MKLYTADQVRNAIAMGYDWCHQKHIPSDDMIDTFIEQLTTIGLPSDEGIKKIMELDDMEFDEFDPYHLSHLDGAKWMRDKIQGGNK